MVWRAEDPQGNEAAKVRWDIVPYTRGVVLDLGCGSEKAFPHFLGIDSGKDTELFGIPIQPDLRVEDCADLSRVIQPGSCDAVFSSHLLEHIEDYRSALASWWSCLKDGGYLVLYLPHRDHYPNIGQPGANPDHRHDFDPSDIVQAMRTMPGGWDLAVQEVRTEGREYSFLQVFRKTQGTHCFSYLDPMSEPERPTVCVVRYGGFGDMLQAANLLPGLQRQGYRVTVMTTPAGKDILRQDPNIDDWFLQDPDQVPNHWLNEFWKHIAKRFDRFINLCESVEGTLLAIPGRANHAWPFALRHARMNDNYFEFMAALAEVPFAPDARFYPTIEETENARARLLPGGLNVVWALAGSSLHKFYPGQDEVITQILRAYPESRIFLVGDAACAILEQGWEDETRVVRLSGELPIRDTLALAQLADCVIGGETGVLNAVAFSPLRKVVLLSHSSTNNLTKHWVNTAALVPEVACHPCHRLHYTREFCFQDEGTGAALCQSQISPEEVFAALDVFREQDAA